MPAAAAAVAAARPGWLSVEPAVLGWAGVVVGAAGTASGDGLGLGGVGVWFWMAGPEQGMVPGVAWQSPVDLPRGWVWHWPEPGAPTRHLSC